MNDPIVSTADLLRRFDLRPNKRLGQNFLIDPTAMQKVVDAADLDAQDSVLEIGAGLGSLTRLLSFKAKRVVAVELDAQLLPALKEVLGACQNVEIVQGDILSLNPTSLMNEKGIPPGKGYKVAANIPYYITSAVIRHLLEASLRPTRLVLTIQREVAERLTAKPGEMSLLAISVQVYGKPEVVGQIPAGAFYPEPQVDSAVVRVELYPQPLFPEKTLGRLFHLAKAGFSQKRKTLRNSLSGGLAISPQQAILLLEQAGIDPNRRAETLSLEEWGKMAILPSPD